ncbi:MAG: hypothetical protein ACI9Z4_002381 [Polaribacter sp.]|jgi:hypothetical protein
MKKNYIFTLLLLLGFSISTFGQVFITELADPNDNADARYIELYNFGDASVDLNNWRIDKYTNANATVSQTLILTGAIASKGFYIIATGPADTVVFDQWNVTPDQWDPGSNNVAGGNGDDNLELYNAESTLIDQFGVPGEDGTNTNHEFEDGRAERNANITAANATWDVSEWSIDNDGGDGDGEVDVTGFDPGAWIGTTTSPIVSVGSAVSGLDYFEGNGPSLEKTFSVEGINLTANVGVSAPVDFEISLTSNGTFTSAVTLTQIEGTLASTTVYVRLKADLVVHTYAGEAATSSAGAAVKTVALSGEITAANPQFSVTAFLDDFNYVISDAVPSLEQTFAVEGLFLTNNLVVTAPTDYEVSLVTGSVFSASVTIAPSSGEVAETTIYARLKAGLNAGNYTGTIIVSSSGVEDATIEVNGNAFGAVTNSMVITGVYDGSLSGGTPKGVSIFVLKEIADLSLFGVSSVSNGGGSTAGTIEFSFPAVSVIAGTFIYVSTEAPNFTTFFGMAPTYTSGSMAINGDDAIELYERGQIIDVYGDVDNDFSGETFDYLDGWAYRKSNTGPEGTTFTATNWTYSGVDGLEGGSDNASATSPFPIGTYRIETASVERNAVLGYTIYPNPITNKEFTISSSSASVKEIAIFNVLGNKVVATRFFGTKAIINVSAISAGIYILKVMEAGKTATNKLVIR